MNALNISMEHEIESAYKDYHDHYYWTDYPLPEGGPEPFHLFLSKRIKKQLGGESDMKSSVHSANIQMQTERESFRDEIKGFNVELWRASPSLRPSPAI